MPWYEMVCEICNVEFEDLFSAQSPIPTLCPNPECKADGHIKRLIPSVVYSRVPLTGSELKQQIKKETQQIKEKVKTDENLRANVMGEAKYEQVLTAKKKLNDTYK